ncbi:MAG: nicotinate phosphoribosyltransferase [Ilumatobacteraceae bacterium]
MSERHVDPVALLTDRYELSVLRAALQSGRAATSCVFEVFTRRLPTGRRYGVVAGTQRVLDAIADFRFDEDDLQWLQDEGVVDPATAEHLRAYRFTGSVDGYPEGEVYFPASPVLSFRGTFAECVLLETVVLSIMNHDAAVAAAASRMVTAAGGRPIIEMGSRRVHEGGAVAAARAAYIAGFDATSNLAAGRRHGIPTAGTASHASVLLHATEREAFAAQIDVLGLGTTLLVDTYDIGRGIEEAAAVAGPGLGAIRIDSGDLGVMARLARAQLDGLGLTQTRIVVSGDLDEHAIAALAVAPVDVYGVGTSVATGSGAPTAGFVYKLVEVDGRPVAKRSDQKATKGGAKAGFRAHRASGTATDELVVVGATSALEAEVARLRTEHHDVRRVSTSLVHDGRPAEGHDGSLAAARTRLHDALELLPWEGLSLTQGDPVLATSMLPGRR